MFSASRRRQLAASVAAVAASLPMTSNAAAVSTWMPVAMPGSVVTWRLLSLE